MDYKEFLSKMFKIEDSGRLAAMRRLFGHGGSEIEGLKILARLGVRVSDPVESMPYKIVAYIYSRKVPNEKAGNLAATMHRAALAKEGSSEDGELSFDRRFDTLVASRDCDHIKSHLIKIMPLFEEHPIDYDLLLRDLIEWSSEVRDRWIETYYQA